jgi:hypothetical protein
MTQMMTPDRRGEATMFARRGYHTCSIRDSANILQRNCLAQGALR